MLYDKEAIICGLCGHSFEIEVLCCTHTEGSPDLDYRPAPMERNTMNEWINKCPACGYVCTRSRIEENAEIHRDFITTEAYLTCEGANLKKELACDFYRHALILIREGKTAEAYDAFLHAAWASDDECDEEGAIICRNKAVSVYRDEMFEVKGTLWLRHVDLLRRTHRFDEAIAFAKRLTVKKEPYISILKLQLKLCENRDAQCYCVDDCE